jgi:diamine N-acetyltransferase
MVKLESEIMKLRPPELTDLNLMYIWENDTSSWYVSNTLTPFSKYVLGRYIETAHCDIFETKQLRLMIELKNLPPQTIGTIDLFEYDPFNQRAGVGILIADKSKRKQGYASEALRLVIDYAFDILCLHQLYCNISVNNTASIGLFQKLGFEIIGEKKDWNRTKDDFLNEYILQLIHGVHPEKSENSGI